jgi:SET domain-containing protein
MYSPLPECLTIKSSRIHGLGLFAIQDIPKETNLGISHVFNTGFPQNWARTPLGGFYNHSDAPNCHLKDSFASESFIATKILITLKDIPKNTELTCKYTLYKIKEKDITNATTSKEDTKQSTETRI